MIPEWEPVSVAAHRCVMCDGPVYKYLGCPALTCSPRCTKDRRNTLAYMARRRGDKGGLTPRRFFRCKICNKVLDNDVNKQTQLCSYACIIASRRVAMTKFNNKRKLSKPHRTVICVVCGNVFRKYGNTKTCSIDCRLTYYDQLRKDYWLRVRPIRLKKRHCKECGAEVHSAFGKPGFGARVVCNDCKPGLLKQAAERGRNYERTISLARLTLRELGIETSKGATALIVLQSMGITLEEEDA